MRTPGRCTNFETCWLANGRRDIRVMVGDPFVCPACGEPLHAPSIESISASGIAGAVAVSLALVAAAGGAGFSAVRLAQTTDLTTVAALIMRAPVQPAQRLAMQAKTLPGPEHHGDEPAFSSSGVSTAPPAAPHAPVVVGSAASSAPASASSPTMQPLGATPIHVAPAPVAELASIAPATFVPDATAPRVAVAEDQFLQPPQMQPPHLPGPVTPTGKVIVVSAEPHRQLTLPISFGRPKAPEDDTPARSAHWRHHAIGLERRTGFLPPADWSADDATAVQQAQQAMPPVQGDSDYDSSAIDAANVSAEQPTNATPSQQPDLAARGEGGTVDNAASVPAQQADMGAPGVAPMGGVRFDSMSAPSQLTRLIVPATLGAVRMPAYQDVARVDPTVAAAVDRAPGAEARLATLPPAPADKLAVPEYPPQAEAADQPGRVDVGCIITPHGLPSGCEVQHQEGGQSFAHSVLTWLKSGTVRYRPSVIAGHPAPEPHQYKVRFEP